MKEDFKVDGKGIWDFLTSRKVVLEDKHNQKVFALQLLWFLVAMIFLSGFIIVGLIISLFFGCKISILDTRLNSINKDRY